MRSWFGSCPRYLLNRSRHERELEREMGLFTGRWQPATEASVSATRCGCVKSPRCLGMTWLDRLGQTLRHPLETLRRAPGFTTRRAVATPRERESASTSPRLASLNLVILKPFPVRDPGTLLRLEAPRPPLGSLPISRTGSGLHPLQSSER